MFYLLSFLADRWRGDAEPLRLSFKKHERNGRAVRQRARL